MKNKQLNKARALALEFLIYKAKQTKEEADALGITFGSLDILTYKALTLEYLVSGQYAIETDLN